MNRRGKAFLLALPTLLALLILFVLPMLYIFFSTIGTDGLTYYEKFLTDSFYVNILRTTVRVSLKTTFFSLLLGYPAAFYLARAKSKLKNLLMIMTVFPFLVSAVVRSYGWMVILGKNGLLNQLLLGIGLIHKPLTILYTETAVVIGLVHLLTPYMILNVASVIQGIDRNVEYAAYSLGANPVFTFFKVVFPLSAPGVISGCILVFTLSMTGYVTPKLLGGAKFRVMSTMVFQEINVNFNWGFASAISYILLFVILVILLSSNYLGMRYTKKLGGCRNA